MKKESMEYRDGTRSPAHEVERPRVEPSRDGEQFTVRPFAMDAGEYVALISSEEAVRWGIHSQDRIRISAAGRSVTAIVHTSSSLVGPGELGVLKRLTDDLGLKDGDSVSVFLSGRPESIPVIKKKMRGETLVKEEIRLVIRDLVEHNLSDIVDPRLFAAADVDGATRNAVSRHRGYHVAHAHRLRRRVDVRLKPRNA